MTWVEPKSCHLATLGVVWGRQRWSHWQLGGQGSLSQTCGIQGCLLMRPPSPSPPGDCARSGSRSLVWMVGWGSSCLGCSGVHLGVVPLAPLCTSSSHVTKGQAVRGGVGGRIQAPGDLL